ncbi:MAG: roadblock/LC7 domain-containing protein [Myxococcales bacterium]|nr:roadblock/LC7 domain-containing protein [Myxococcales bacterium]
MNSPLRLLREQNRSVIAAALLAHDGALIEASSDGALEDTLCSFVAALRSLSERTLAELGGGTLDTMILAGDSATLLFADAGPERVLAALVSDRAPLGLALSDLRNTARTYAEVR